MFDSKYYAFYEDADFCWRTWIYGYDVVYAPKSFIYHKIGGTIKNQEHRLYLTEKNRLRTLLKNYELKSLIRILPGYYIKRFNKIWELKNVVRLGFIFSSLPFIKVLRSYEGNAEKPIWIAIQEVLPPELKFYGRQANRYVKNSIHYGSKAFDVFNAALNFLYFQLFYISLSC